MLNTIMATATDGDLKATIVAGLSSHLAATVIIVAAAHAVERLWHRALTGWHLWHAKHPNLPHRAHDVMRHLVRRETRSFDAFRLSTEEVLQSHIAWCIITLGLYLSSTVFGG